MKFKVGDRVKIISSTVSNGKPYSPGNGDIGKITTISEIKGDKIRFTDENILFAYEHDLQLMEKTMDNLQYGDVLVNDDYESDIIVQGTMGEIVFYVDSDDHESSLYSVTELKERGWKLKSSEHLELTVAEVAEKLGVDSVKIVKEK